MFVKCFIESRTKSVNDKLAIVSVNFLVRSVAPIFGEYLEERIGKFENAFIWHGGIFMAELLNKTL